MRVRHLMIAIVHVAIALAIYMTAARNLNSVGNLRFISAFLVVPPTLIVVSLFTVNAGPHRELLLTLFSSSFWAFAVLVMITMIAVTLLIPGTANHLSPIVRTILSIVIIIPPLIFCGAGLLVYFWVVADILFPERCPRCGQKKLVSTSNIWIILRPTKSCTPTYYKCMDCEFVTFLRKPGLRPKCRSCGGKNLETQRYAFFWCLHCGERVKRRFKTPWEPIVSSDDDVFYSLWDFGDWLRSVAKRVKKSH